MELKNGERLLHWPLEQHTLTCGYLNKEGAYHGAIDMRAAEGTPIYAAEDGTVRQIYEKPEGEKPKPGQMSSYGKFLKIEHEKYKGLPLETCYAHASRWVVNVGERVKEGQLIGYTGNTGITSGPHLHFEVRLNRTRRNPLVWLDDNYKDAWPGIFHYYPAEHAVKREVCPHCGKEL